MERRAWDELPAMIHTQHTVAERLMVGCQRPRRLEIQVLRPHGLTLHTRVRHG